MLNFTTPDRSNEQAALPAIPDYSDHKPAAFFLQIAKRLKTENESERSRINAQTIVQMCRRHRNMTPGDAFGFWRNSVWCESPSFSTLHNVPIFQQLVVGAESNFGQADIRLDITANSHTFPHRATEKIAKDIYEILNERQWTETNRAAAFYAAILMNNAFYISRFNKDKGDDIAVPKFDDVSYEMGGVGVCTECYQQAEPNAEECAKCGGSSFSIIDEPRTVEDQLVSMFDMAKTGEAEMVIADGLDVSVDPNGKPSDIESCRWVEWRIMAQKDELKRLYPHLKCEGMPVWSYQTRLKKALKRYESGESGPMSETDKTEFEVRHIWLDKTEYEGYCCPEDLKLGKEVILARGEKAADKFPDGMALGIVGQEIAYIDNENKNKRISASLWISDGVSFEGVGAKAGLAIQRKINQLENIAMEGETRSLKGSLLYNPEAIDGAHLEGANTNIPLKKDFALGAGKLQDHALPFKVEGLSAETLLYMDRQKQTMQEVMGIPDVMLGQDTSTDKTFGGQALRSRNALGLLTPKTQSTARAKELWLVHQLDIIQTYYSPEALRQFGSRSGNEWTDEEIEAFFAADIDKYLTVSYVPGTEIPESRFEKQMRLREDVLSGVIPMTPALMSKIALESNYDAPDIGNFESNRKLAEKRYKFITDTVTPQMDAVYQQFEMQMIDPMTGMRAIDPTGQPIPNPVIMQFMQAAELVIYDFVEDHMQMTEFWGDKVRELAGASKITSPTLIAMCDAMVRRHNQSSFSRGIVEQGQLGAVQAAAQAPAQIGQKMLESGEDDGKGEEYARDQEKQSSDQSHQKDIKKMELADKEKDRKHDMEKAKLQAKGKEKAAAAKK